MHHHKESRGNILRKFRQQFRKRLHAPGGTPDHNDIMTRCFFSPPLSHPTIIYPKSISASPANDPRRFTHRERRCAVSNTGLRFVKAIEPKPVSFDKLTEFEQFFA